MPGERTEQATQHRREKARKEGDMLHSRELSAAAGTLAGVLALGAAGRPHARWLAGDLCRLSRSGQPGALGARARSSPRSSPCAGSRSRCLAPPAAVMAAVAAAALGAGILQTGGVNFHAGAIGFKPDRINPVSNLKNLFSLRAAARLAKSLLPASLLAVFAVQRIGPAVDHASLLDRAARTTRLAMSTGCCWPPPGCSSAGRPSTTWSSGRAASRA